MTIFQQLWLGVAMCVIFLLVTGMILSSGMGRTVPVSDGLAATALDDDWTADLPMDAFPSLVVPILPTEAESPNTQQHPTVPSDDWPPIFAELAQQWGYDSVRGFDTRLVSA